MAEQLANRLGKPVTPQACAKPCTERADRLPDLLLDEVVQTLGKSAEEDLEQELIEPNLLDRLPAGPRPASGQRGRPGSRRVTGMSSARRIIRRARFPEPDEAGQVGRDQTTSVMTESDSNLTSEANPWKQRRTLPAGRIPSLTVMSRLAEASRVPSGVNASAGDHGRRAPDQSAEASATREVPE